MWLFWLIAAGVFFIAEVITVGFLIFWLGIGALLAMIVSLITDNLFIQTAVFVISSIALIFLTKPILNKYVNKDEAIPTNTNSLIGKKAKVIKDISDEVGQVKVEGEVWSAISNDGLGVEKGENVVILGIDGVKLVVEKMD